MVDIYHIGREETDRITEGGVARDIAFSRALIGIAKRVQVGGNALKNIYTVFKFLLSPPMGSIVIVHYPNVGIHISDRFVVGNYIRKAYIFLIERLAKKNVLLIDVADMPSEQAIDLELPTPTHYQDIEHRLFDAATVLVPASLSMKNLILSKYCGLSEKAFIVCNNGAEQYTQITPRSIRTFGPHGAVKFVYAGTLNKGRGIEQLLQAFNGRSEELYLLGSGGDWISERILQSPNVFYMGELSESDAFKFVSDCDVGLIPYHSDRPYYNVAYPTKLSFYLAAGVPYLCTPVAEAIAVQNQYGCGWIHPMEKWVEFMDRLDSEELHIRQKLAFQSSVKFSWESTLKPFVDFLLDKR